MVNSDHEKIVAIMCQAHDGCTLCIAKLLATLCAVYDFDLDYVVDLAIASEPIGVTRDQLLDMVASEHHDLMVEAGRPELLV